MNWLRRLFCGEEKSAHVVELVELHEGDKLAICCEGILRAEHVAMIRDSFDAAFKGSKQIIVLDRSIGKLIVIRGYGSEKPIAVEGAK